MNYETFKRIAEYAGFEIMSYSGRCMFGNKCVGIVVEEGFGGFRLGIELERARLALDEPDEDFPKPSSDNLGMDIIIYWPSIKWVDSEEN